MATKRHKRARKGQPQKGARGAKVPRHEVAAALVETKRLVEEFCMNPPRRIQLRRVKGWRKPPNTKVVARPTVWGNPFRVGFRSYVRGKPVIVKTRAQAVELFRDWLMHDPGAAAQRYFLKNLRGKNLACWCPLDQPCHADILLALANGRPV